MLFSSAKKGKSSAIIATIAISALAAVSLAAHLWIDSVVFADPVVQIRLDGELLHSLPLSQDADIVLDGNIVQIRNGKVGIVDASCPARHCVRTGYVSGAIPIICLPNRIEVRITEHNSSSSLDGITG